MRLIIICISLLASTTILIAACGDDSAPLDAPTRVPDTIAATEPLPPTPSPAATPAATPVPIPTAAASPTDSPVPTATLEPSPTPVATEAELFLQLVNPEELEVITEKSSIEIVGRTRVDAVVTVNDTFVEPDSDGLFSSVVELEEGPNIIEVIASITSGRQTDLVLVVTYIP